MENSYGLGRALAAWLIERDYIVKDVNPALSYAYRKSVQREVCGIMTKERSLRGGEDDGENRK